MAKKRSATSRLLRILLIIVVLIIAGGLIAKMTGMLDGGAGAYQVQTEKAELRTITQLVSSSGRIQPETEVIIRPDVSGEIIELNVKEGDYVREGDLLLRIKPDLYEARIDELNAALLTQQARMEQARSAMLQAEIEYRKVEPLYNQDLVSELEYLQMKNNYDSQEANFTAAQYQIESARAQLRRAEEELQQTVIRSPQNGTISRLAVEVGERVLGQAQTAGTEMMRIARMEQMEVEVDVNENDIVNVSVADTSIIEVDAYPNRVFEGVVTEIANSAQISETGSADQVTNYKVKIRITTPHNLNMTGSEFLAVNVSESPDDAESPDFKPGMSATVDIRTNTVYDVVSIPIQAVTVRDFSRDTIRNSGMGEEEESNLENDTSDDLAENRNRPGRVEEDFRRVVFVNDNGIARRVEVETGISNNTHIQIMSGLAAGDEVITGSYRILSRDLQENDEIEVTNPN